MRPFDPEKITYFAKTDARNADVTFGIKARDRQRHMYVIGKTGMGKSTLLENMAAQDIMNGEGMAFIDPHGSAVETLLHYVPEHRTKDVVYFAPFDMENPVSFNIMEDVGADKRHLVVSGLMSTFKKIWVDAWSARMEYILTNALLVLIEYPDTTLLSVNRLFTDKKFREKVVDYCKDPAVKAYWTEEFANYTERFAAEALPAIQNKIGQFTGNPLIRNIIGQPKSSFDIREMMDNKKILLMNLSKGMVGESNASLLGSMLTTRIYLAAMSRAELPVEQMKTMPNFYFYVDEFQSFANATFADILSEARKYHLNLIIAHQYISQMEEEVRNAVFGNVGTTVSFRVGPFDAEVLETVFAPRFEAKDLVNLGFAQVYLTLMIDGIGSQPFSARTLAPVETPKVSYREVVVNDSRAIYARPRIEVEKIVEELHTPEKQDPSDNKNNKKGGKQGGGQWNNNNNGSNNRTKPDEKPDWKKGHANGLAVSGDRKPQEQNKDRQAEQNKTGDDLRSVLAKMSQPTDSKAVKAEPVVEKAAAPSSAPQSKSVANHSNYAVASVQKPVVKNDRPAQTKKPFEQKDRPANKQSGNEQIKEENNDLKNSLAGVLARLQSEASVENNVKDEVAKKDNFQSAKKNLDKVRRPALDTAVEVQKIVVSHRIKDKELNKKEELPIKLTSSAERPVKPVAQQAAPTPRAAEESHKHQSVASPVSPDSNARGQRNQAIKSRENDKLDVSEIKRMLQHNDRERSPFER